MTFLPVVERELRVAARKRGTYWNRFGAALVAIGLAFWVLLTNSRTAPEHIGVTLFHTLSGILFIYIAIAGTQATCDSLSIEKRDGTLGLLFLTDLKGYDVVFGKLVSNSLSIVYRVLGVVPILAIPFLLGGVSSGEAWRSFLVALNLLTVSLTIGVYTSALCRDGLAAAKMAAAIFLFLLIAPPLLEFLIKPTQPGVLAICSLSYGCFRTNDIFYQSGRFWFWLHAGWMQVLTWTFLWLACRIVPRSWQDRPVTAKSGIWQRLQRWFALRPTAQAHAQMLEQNPYLWRVRQKQTAAIQVWSALLLLALLWGILQLYVMKIDEVALIVLTLLTAHLAIKLEAAIEACRAIAEDRHTGAMELLLSTPLTPGQITHGQSRAMLYTLAKPVGLVVAIDTICLAIGLRFEFDSGNRDVLIALYFVAVSSLILDVVTASWTGSWLALSAPSAHRAIGGTIFRILFLPVMIFALLATFCAKARVNVSFGGVVFLWAAVCFVCDLFFITRSQSLLQGRFRSVVSEN